METKDIDGRRRVYIMIRRGDNTMTRVLDLSYLGSQPIAVVTWIRRDKDLVPGRYIKLDPAKLRSAAPAGAMQYDGIVDEPH